MMKQSPSPSAQECVLKSTLAAFSAIQAAHSAAIEAFKARPAASTERHQAIALDDDEGRFEDADEQELEENAPLISTPVDETQLVQQTPRSKTAEHPQRPSPQPAEEVTQTAKPTTSSANVNVSMHILTHQGEKQQKQTKNSSIFPQPGNDLAQTSSDAGREKQISSYAGREKQTIDFPDVQPRLRSPQFPRLNETLSV